jgi:hypothetical protein
VIKYRFKTIWDALENKSTVKIRTQKQKFEDLSLKFIVLLKEYKRGGISLEDAIQSIFYDKQASKIKKLSSLTSNLSILIHYFSEEIIYIQPKFLKVILILTQNICLVKKCLYKHFSEFYEELKINYQNLENDLENFLKITLDVKNKEKIKKLEERLIL